MSSAQQQVIVKVYYNDLNETHPEIRRFALDVSPNIDVYQTLETTISELNGDYLREQFTLQYTDEDNDRITFSSDSEFRSALKNNLTNGTIKIFVKPKSKKNEQTNQNTSTHTGVTCDGCQGPVVGNRYKCMECVNYDLCQTCSDKNLHSEHNMLKLTRPAQHRRHLMRQQYKPFGHHAPCGMTNFLRQFKGKELSELIETCIPEYLRPEKLNEMLNQFKTGEQTDKPVDGKILLENVGKIFSSFGINCDNSDDKQTGQSKPKEEKEAAVSNNTTSAEPKSPTSASTSADVPPLGNLLEQLQTVFAPMFQQPATNNQKKIDECIERMISMGFVDSNGVLTELIKSKKGDLDQVLDALNPRNYKN